MFWLWFAHEAAPNNPRCTSIRTVCLKTPRWGMGQGCQGHGDSKIVECWILSLSILKYYTIDLDIVWSERLHTFAKCRKNWPIQSMFFQETSDTDSLLKIATCSYSRFFCFFGSTLNPKLNIDMQHSSFRMRISASGIPWISAPRQGHALLVRSGIKGSAEMVVPHEGSVCLQRESKVLWTNPSVFSMEFASYHPI